jgi:UDP-2,3-diacylglucosamine pyrophosphatase LpxH
MPGRFLYPGLLEYVKEGIEENKSINSMYDFAIVKFGYEKDLQTFRRYVYTVKKRYSDLNKSNGKKQVAKDEAFISTLERRKIISRDDMCDLLSCSFNEVCDLIGFYRNQGYEILLDDKNIILSTHVASQGKKFSSPLESTEIIFGVASDLHIGSKQCQLTALNEFCEICRKKGVKNIFIPGDIFAGYKVFAGQEYEVYALSAEEQEESAIVNLPTGFEWYAMGGNHDYSFIKKGGGHNPLLALENKRPDVHYLGFDEVDVPILEGIALKMWHPSGGVPYALSYRLQKAAEQIAYSESAKLAWNKTDVPKIRFLLAGHIHINVCAMIGAIFAAQCGTFEAQNSYLKVKGLNPTVGGYIIRAELRKNDGMILNHEAKYYIFPDVIEDDWKNYKHHLDERDKIKPIFNGK